MRRTFKTKRRLLYPAGLISLSILPFICFSFLENKLRSRTESCIEVNVISAQWLTEIDETFGRPLWKVPELDYLEIKLTGNDNEDQLNLNFARIYAAGMFLEGDTIHGIHYHFENQAKYWTWVNVWEILAIYRKSGIKHRRMNMLCVDNNIWFWVVPPPKPIGKTDEIQYWTCGYRPVNIEPVKPNRYVIAINYSKKIVKQFWPIFVYLIFMIGWVVYFRNRKGY